jgi:hypothetical protein
VTLIESAPVVGATATSWLQPSWTLDDYRHLLQNVVGEWGRFIELDDYARGTPGVWLRHDVELSLRAAELMATVEHRLGVRATYFLCPGSPLLQRHTRRLAQTAARLAQLGHDVGVHVQDAPPHELPPWATTPHVSFHAPTRPGTSPAASTRTILHDLASTASGAAVYWAVAQNRSHYASDSTGRWRSPTPWRRPDDGTTTQLQLLTHPYWWARRTGLHALEMTVDASRFLPKAAALRHHGPSEGWRTSELPVTRPNS